MEISRRRVVNGVNSRSASKVPLDQILALDTVEVPAGDPKFGGFRGCAVSALLGAATGGTATGGTATGGTATGGTATGGTATGGTATGGTATGGAGTGTGTGGTTP